MKSRLFVQGLADMATGMAVNPLFAVPGAAASPAAANRVAEHTVDCKR